MLYREYPAEEITRAVQQAVEKRISSSEGVRHLLLASREENRSTVTPDGWDILPTTDIAQYAQLGGVL